MGTFQNAHMYMPFFAIFVGRFLNFNGRFSDISYIFFINGRLNSFPPAVVRPRILILKNRIAGRDFIRRKNFHVQDMRGDPFNIRMGAAGHCRWKQI